jgi:hypothetical protein
VIATKIEVPETRALKRGCGCLSIDACELLNPDDDEAAEGGSVRTTSKKTANVLTRPRRPERGALQTGFVLSPLRLGVGSAGRCGGSLGRERQYRRV